MKNKKLLVTDCDGVLLDWHEGFLTWIGEVYGFKIDPSHPHNTWEFFNWFLPNKETGEILTQNKLTEYIIEYNGYPRVLKPLLSAQAGIDLLKSAHGSDLDIKVLTSFGSCPIQSKFREDYLNVLFDGAFSEVIVLPLGSCKEEKLRELNPDWFVEDNFSHASKASALGIKTFLINTTYNQGEGSFIRVKDWIGVEDEIYCDIEGVE